MSEREPRRHRPDQRRSLFNKGKDFIGRTKDNTLSLECSGIVMGTSLISFAQNLFHSGNSVDAVGYGIAGVTAALASNTISQWVMQDFAENGHFDQNKDLSTTFNRQAELKGTLNRLVKYGIVEGMSIRYAINNTLHGRFISLSSAIVAIPTYLAFRISIQTADQLEQDAQKLAPPQP